MFKGISYYRDFVIGLDVFGYFGVFRMYLFW